MHKVFNVLLTLAFLTPLFVCHEGGDEPIREIGGHPPLGITARATVDRVIDGDTIKVVVHWPVTIRLKDCWAPEVRGEQRPEGLESKAYLADLLKPDGGGEPASVVFSVDSENADSLGDLMTFGRVVGTVWRPGDDDSLSEIMVEAGKATKEKQ